MSSAGSGVPDRIGPYEPLHRIGRGGMGSVYFAYAPGGHPVAVKVMHDAIAADPDSRRRFAREVAALAKVTGPYLLPLLDSDTAAEQPWLVTPYAPGPTLDTYIRQYGPLTGPNLNTFAAATAHALACIHAAGIAHRDLKPQNVILAADGPRVLDFGIAHHLDATAVTATRMTTGTPGWMAPEQLSKGETVTATDLFAWGILTAYAAAGKHPFGTPTGIEHRILSQAPDLEEVPDDLLSPVVAALAKNPADRPLACDLADRLAALTGPEGTRVFPTLVYTRAAPMGPAGIIPSGQWNIPAPAEDLTAVYQPPAPRPELLAELVDIGNRYFFLKEEIRRHHDTWRDQPISDLIAATDAVYPTTHEQRAAISRESLADLRNRADLLESLFEDFLRREPERTADDALHELGALHHRISLIADPFQRAQYRQTLMKADGLVPPTAERGHVTAERAELLAYAVEEAFDTLDPLLPEFEARNPWLRS
ncbi:serine/threonine-protein kinase [Streptomyces sp. NPDC048603]|uniref:serine/threonine-protein kinase n=1 Tax=Streptomyces sp. NPDC048603 TaxID=3365577 RepID=UPI003714F0B2